MLTLTRKTGESVWVGDYLVTVKGVSRGCELLVVGPGLLQGYTVEPGQSVLFGGGAVTAVPRMSNDRIGLSFAFPRHVTILRTELVAC